MCVCGFLCVTISARVCCFFVLLPLFSLPNKWQNFKQNFIGGIRVHCMFGAPFLSLSYQITLLNPARCIRKWNRSGFIAMHFHSAPFFSCIRCTHTHMHCFIALITSNLQVDTFESSKCYDVSDECKMGSIDTHKLIIWDIDQCLAFMRSSHTLNPTLHKYKQTSLEIDSPSASPLSFNLLRSTDMCSGMKTNTRT